MFDRGCSLFGFSAHDNSLQINLWREPGTPRLSQIHRLRLGLADSSMYGCIVPGFYEIVLNNQVTRNMKDTEAVDYELHKGLTWMFRVDHTVFGQVKMV
ncbi:hypothetical protein EDB87DRAFT_1003471 [Lactarius vividus]|nr:hypothetical protein EDB87DRAFT_1003471 [Lactarius vividus]